MPTHPERQHHKLFHQILAKGPTPLSRAFIVLFTVSLTSRIIRELLSDLLKSTQSPKKSFTGLKIACNPPTPLWLCQALFGWLWPFCFVWHLCSGASFQVSSLHLPSVLFHGPEQPSKGKWTSRLHHMLDDTLILIRRHIWITRNFRNKRTKLRTLPSKSLQVHIERYIPSKPQIPSQGT